MRDVDHFENLMILSAIMTVRWFYSVSPDIRVPGVAVMNHHGITLDKLLVIADIALYKAKNAGRDQVVIA